MIPPEVSQAALEVVPRINVDDVQLSISPATFHDFKQALSPFATGSDRLTGGSEAHCEPAKVTSKSLSPEYARSERAARRCSLGP